MILRLDSQEVMERFLWLLFPGLSVELIRPKVDYGGMGLRSEYHLKVVKDTNVRDCVGMFPSFPYDIWTPAQLTAYQMPEDFLFGLLSISLPLNLNSDELVLQSCFFCRCCWIPPVCIPYL